MFHFNSTHIDFGKEQNDGGSCSCLNSYYLVENEDIMFSETTFVEPPNSLITSSDAFMDPGISLRNEPSIMQFTEQPTMHNPLEDYDALGMDIVVGCLGVKCNY